ncbi:TonB-dependent receptor [Pleurocapsales cyanobacterium LEGE 06147]|nr:TonB-dependent receptor [Pleurocapsales cyanobacterium LEGE 06147]
MGKVNFSPNINKHNNINLDRSSQALTNGNWTIADSFRAAYISWDRTNNLSSSQTQNELEKERYFDYGEFPLEEFYSLIIETTQDFQTGNLNHETIIGVEVIKNPFILFGESIEPSSYALEILTNSLLPSPYLARDFVSKKNYLGLFIEHEINLSDRLSFNFEGTLDVVIDDTIDIPEIPFVEPTENNNFYPEIALDYQLTDKIWLFASFEYAAEPIAGTDARDLPLRAEIYRGFEVGIETELSNNWLATLSFYHETQNNITTIDPNEPDFNLQINQQISQSWIGELRGEITPGWWVYGFYTYTDATVTKDEEIQIGNQVEGVARHSGGFWTSYEITRGSWQGWGFGGGILVNGDRPGDTTNSFTLPSYLQTDAAIFYSQNNFKAAISVQNLFNAGVDNDGEATPRSLFSTLWFQF